MQDEVGTNCFLLAQSFNAEFIQTIISCLCLQVLSGDAVIIRGQPKGGPPPERQICLSNITAPKMARKANPNIENSVQTQDEVRIGFW